MYNFAERLIICYVDSLSGEEAQHFRNENSTIEWLWFANREVEWRLLTIARHTWIVIGLLYKCTSIVDGKIMILCSLDTYTTNGAIYLPHKNNDIAKRGNRAQGVLNSLSKMARLLIMEMTWWMWYEDAMQQQFVDVAECDVMVVHENPFSFESSY